MTIKLCALLTGIAAFALSAAQAADKPPIKIGVLEDQSGEFAAATLPKVHGIELAAEEINKAGGIAGRQDRAGGLRHPVRQYPLPGIHAPRAPARQGGRGLRRRSPAPRARPTGRSSTSRRLAFYNNQYEGGVCDANMIVTGAVPEQQFSTLIPWMMEKYGKKVYTIAADYNFGQISAEWVRKSSRRTAARWSARSSSRSACRSSPRPSRTSSG